jgi:type I restriction enzyme S subunit
MSEWPQARLRDVASQIKDGTHGTHARVESGVPFLSAKNVGSNGRLNWSKADEQVSESDYSAITATFTPKRGDLLLTIVGTIGRSALFDGSRVVFQRSVAFVRCDDRVLPEYLFQASCSESFTRQLERRCNITAQAGLYLGELAKVTVPLPPPKQQRKIAAILASIDTAIEKTEALVEKYQQIKAGLMHDLFTRGVLPNGQLRPPREQAPELYQETAIGWIPKEWRCSKLSRIADLFVGFAFKSDSFQQDGVNLLRGENVGSGIPNWQDRQCLDPSTAGVFKEYLLSPGDIVIGMDRTFTKSGVKISRLREDDCPALLVQRVGKFIAVDCHPSYLRWIVLSSGYLRRLVNQQKGMDIPHLSKSEILDPLVPVPSQDEQQRIADRVRIPVNLIENSQIDLQKLHQQKLGLMQDLLTGKVPVKVGAGETANG